MKVMRATHKHKKRLLPCGTCMYLIDGKLCPFVNCIRLDGWVAKDGQKTKKDVR